MKKKKTSLIWAFAVLAAAFLGLALLLSWGAGPPGVEPPSMPPIVHSPSAAPAVTAAPTPSPTPVQTAGPVPEGTPPVAEAPLEEDDDGLPLDQLFITPARRRYEDGALRLIIPKLDVDEPLLNGVDEDTLLKGVGLYDYAQLPGEGRSNTSIAGHRNWIRGGKITLDQPFSYLDTLEEGDYLYLRGEEFIYQYAWESSEVVEPDDWSPIYKREYSCVTLTTCTPIGVSDHRLIVRGFLVDTIPTTDDYGYPADKEADAQ